MKKNIFYYGKAIPSSCAVILMKLFHVYKFKYPFFNYITTEVFNYQSIKEDNCKWYCSYPYGIDALYTGLQIMGINQKTVLKKSNFNNIRNFDGCLKEQLDNGACILGPINFSSAWGSIESRYFQGYAQFAYVSEIEEDYYILQDPNGCPQMKVTLEMLWSMAKDCKNISLINFDVSQYKPRDLNVIGIDIFKRLLSNRFNLIGTSNIFLSCMKELSVNFKTQNMKSSELLSLKYVLCHLTRSLFFLTEFIQYFKSTYACNEIKYSIDQVLSMLEEYMTTIDYLYNEEHNSFNIGEIVATISLYEEYLDRYSKKLLKKIGDSDV